MPKEVSEGPAPGIAPRAKLALANALRETSGRCLSGTSASVVPRWPCRYLSLPLAIAQDVMLRAVARVGQMVLSASVKDSTPLRSLVRFSITLVGSAKSWGGLEAKPSSKSPKSAPHWATHWGSSPWAVLCWQSVHFSTTRSSSFR